VLTGGLPLQALRCKARSRQLVVVRGAAAGSTVVLVESPAKAKKIQGFLGGGYKVGGTDVLVWHSGLAATGLALWAGCNVGASTGL
jgi:hypothetical protein